MDPTLAATLHAYARDGLPQHVQAVCSSAMQRRGGASAGLQFWRAYGLLAAGATAEAMRELAAVQGHPEVQLAAAAAMLSVHQAAATAAVDTDATLQLSALLEVEEPDVCGPAALHLSAFLLYSHEFERARAILERQMQPQQQHGGSNACVDAATRARAQALLGFLLLEQQARETPELRDAGELAHALQLFDGLLARDPSDVEAVLGKARALEATGEQQAAWRLLSEAALQQHCAVPVLLEELARFALAQQDWEGLAEVLGHLQEQDDSNALAAAYQALMSLLLDGSSSAAQQHLVDMAARVLQGEPRNAALMMQLAAAFARLAGSDATLLSTTLELAEKALQLQPDNIHYVVEVASQRLLLEQPAAAIDGYEAALKLDELNMRAALGLVEACLAADRLEEAEQQLAFLPELLAASRTAAGSLGVHAVLGSSSSTHGSEALGFGSSSWRLGHAATALAAGRRRTSCRQSDSSAQAGLQLVAGGSVVDAVHREEPLLLYLGGLLAWKQGKQQQGLQQLLQFVEAQLEAVDDLPFGLGLLGALNASRILGLLRLLLAGAGGDPRQPSDAPSPLLSACIRVLEMLSRFTLAHPEVQLLAARTQYLNGALDAAARKAADILRTNGDSIQAALLVVSVHSWQGRHADAMSALDAAVAANFSIRESPLYQLVRAQVLAAKGQLEDAKQVLEAALSLPGVQSAPTPEQTARLARRGCLPSLHERASIYLLLADVIMRLAKGGEAPEARKYLAEAVAKFTGTREEVRVMVADCEAAVAAGDTAGALMRLQRVPDSSPHYARARVAMASIYLSHKHDRAAFIKCHLDLVEKTPDYDTHCLLAGAFMTIQEPDRAARAFETAMAMRPKDSDIALSAAHAHIAAHDYNRAIDCYNKVIRNEPGKLDVQHALARLLLRLGQARQAAVVLDKCLEAHKARSGVAGRSLEALALEVETWLLMAQLQQTGDEDGFVAAHGRALELQRALLEQLREPSSGAAAAQQHVGSPGSRHKAAGPSLVAAASVTSAAAHAASICFELAEFHRKRRRFDKAEESYRACLVHQPKHGQARHALACLALTNGQVQECQSYTAALLEDEPDNEAAAVMLAELMVHQDNINSAVYHFQQMLVHNPCHYPALEQLLGLLRRDGKLSEAAKYIAAAEAAASAGHGVSTGAESSHGASSPAAGKGPGGASTGGLHYCHGLLHRYQGNPREALTHFSAARRDARWCSAALLAMAEVYLDPSAQVCWASEGGAVDAAGNDDADARSTADAARSLLQQLRPADMESSKYKVLSAYALMASKARADIEAAVRQLLDLAAADANDVPVLLALAHGFLLLKQTAKARNQLKRVSKLPYKPDVADEFERAWLALAEIHIAGGKYDLAQELCNRCLKYNRSCGRAWELLGGVAEREAAYKDAAAAYEHAWQLAGGSDAAVGYKLGFSLLKAGRLVDAASVAAAVLKADPAYAAIRADVLDKARAGLRP